MRLNRVKALPFLVNCCYYSCTAIAQRVIEVDTWEDNTDVGSVDALDSQLAATLCSEANGSCSLRVALTFASALNESDVKINVNVGQELELTQKRSIPVTGPRTIFLSGNGHTVRDAGGDSFFTVNGSTTATFSNTHFKGFHATGLANEIANGVVISADDPNSTVYIEGCTFREVYSNETTGFTGMGGAVYSSGSLDIRNSTFDSINLEFQSSSSHSVYIRSSTNYTDSSGFGRNSSSTSIPTTAMPSTSSPIMNYSTAAPTKEDGISSTSNVTPAPSSYDMRPALSTNYSISAPSTNPEYTKENFTFYNTTPAPSSYDMMPAPSTNYSTSAPSVNAGYSTGNSTFYNSTPAASSYNMMPAPSINYSTSAPSTEPGYSTKNFTFNNSTPAPSSYDMMPALSTNYSTSAPSADPGYSTGTNSFYNSTPAPSSYDMTQAPSTNYSTSAPSTNPRYTKENFTFYNSTPAPSSYDMVAPLSTNDSPSAPSTEPGYSTENIIFYNSTPVPSSYDTMPAPSTNYSTSAPSTNPGYSTGNSTFLNSTPAPSSYDMMPVLSTNYSTSAPSVNAGFSTGNFTFNNSTPAPSSYDMMPALSTNYSTSAPSTNPRYSTGNSTFYNSTPAPSSYDTMPAPSTNDSTSAPSTNPEYTKENFTFYNSTPAPSSYDMVAPLSTNDSPSAPSTEPGYSTENIIFYNSTPVPSSYDTMPALSTNYSTSAPSTNPEYSTGNSTFNNSTPAPSKYDMVPVFLTNYSTLAPSTEPRYSTENIIFYNSTPVPSSYDTMPAPSTNYSTSAPSTNPRYSTGNFTSYNSTLAPSSYDMMPVPSTNYSTSSPSVDAGYSTGNSTFLNSTPAPSSYDMMPALSTNYSTSAPSTNPRYSTRNFTFNNSTPAPSSYDMVPVFLTNYSTSAPSVNAGYSTGTNSFYNSTPAPSSYDTMPAPSTTYSTSAPSTNPEYSTENFTFYNSTPAPSSYDMVAPLSTNGSTSAPSTEPGYSTGNSTFYNSTPVPSSYDTMPALSTNYSTSAPSPNPGYSTGNPTFLNSTPAPSSFDMMPVLSTNYSTSAPSVNAGYSTGNSTFYNSTPAPSSYDTMPAPSTNYSTSAPSTNPGYTKENFTFYNSTPAPSSYDMVAPLSTNDSTSAPSTEPRYSTENIIFYNSTPVPSSYDTMPAPSTNYSTSAPSTNPGYSTGNFTSYNSTLAPSSYDMMPTLSTNYSTSAPSTDPGFSTGNFSFYNATPAPSSYDMMPAPSTNNSTPAPSTNIGYSTENFTFHNPTPAPSSYDTMPALSTNYSTSAPSTNLGYSTGNSTFYKQWYTPEDYDPASSGYDDLVIKYVGGIKDSGKTLNIIGCQFLNNSVNAEDQETWGGAILAIGGLINIADSIFIGNSASYGGALAVEESKLIITDSHLSDNFADQYGGGFVHAGGDSLYIDDTMFDSNAAAGGGGALAVASTSKDDRFNLTNCGFFGNTAGGQGGGAVFLFVDEERASALDGGTIEITSPTFESNTATNYGSIITVMCGHVIIDSAYASGYVEDDGAFSIPSLFSNCSTLSFRSTLEMPSNDAPALLSARFSDMGTSIVVNFDKATDYGAVIDLGGSFDCTLLLEYPSASASDVCFWASATIVTATLHYDSSVVPQDKITLLADKIAVEGSNGTVLNVESSTIILAPENPPIPILVPEVWYKALAHCQDLVVDVSSSTGAGGRPMSYIWELYNWTNKQGNAIPEKAISHAEDASALGGWRNLTIPAAGRAIRNKMNWFFNVTVTNWLGESDWQTFDVLVSDEAEDPPLLSLVGGSTRTVLRSSIFTVAAIAKVKKCVNPNKTSVLTYEWSEMRTLETFLSTSAPFPHSVLTDKDPSTFKLPSHSLEVGTSYEFRVDVTDSAGYTSYATQVITVEGSALIALVAGANTTVRAGEEAALDLTVTVDPDEVDGTCSGCVYMVNCTRAITVTQGGCGLTLPDGEFTDGVLILQSSELVSEKSYTFEIAVRRSRESTWAFTSAYLTIGSEAPIPSVSIATIFTDKVNADANVAIIADLTSSLEAGATAEWALTEGILNGYSDLSAAIVSSTEYTVIGAGSISANMVLSPNSLVTGSTYTFTLTATYLFDDLIFQGGDSSTSSASISVLVNSPPTGGLLEVSPGQGMALTDLFFFNTYAWEDDVDDLPIKYSFAYVSGSANGSDTSSEVILRTAIESSVASNVVLPQGYGSSSLLFTSVYAVDSLGASSRSTFDVIVTEYDGGVEELGSLVENIASEALESGDTEAAMQVLDVASSTLNAANCTGAPECIALNRQDCGTDGSREDHTCGECLPGTTGTLGSANSECVDLTAIDYSCSNGVQDGNETDVDCGGSSCTQCPSGSTCIINSDCLYNNCPDPSVATEERTCISPAKACPNNCDGLAHGVCQYFSTISGESINATECLADSSLALCRASCSCFEDYAGDGCQYSPDELEVAVAIRQSSLEFIQVLAATSDVSQETVAQQATLLAKLSAVPEEMEAESVALALELAVSIAQAADGNGHGVISTAATALIEVIDQVIRTSSYLGQESNMTALSAVLGSLISAQVVGVVAGQNPEEVSSDYVRLSTGVYDTAAIGGVQISPPMNSEDEAVGRSTPSIGIPDEIGSTFSGVSILSLAVAEWIIDPRRTSSSSSTTSSSATASTISDASGELISTVIRLYAGPVESTDASSKRSLRGREYGDALSDEAEKRSRRQERSLLEYLGSLEIAIPNTVSQEWDPKDELTFTHACERDSIAKFSSTCPNGTEINTVCSGTALTREVTCSDSGTEPQCSSWQGLAHSSGSASVENCVVTSFNDSWTTCRCDYAVVMGDGTGCNQVDFASTFLSTPSEFIATWSKMRTLTWSDVKSAAAVFSTMGGILGLAIVFAGIGWHLDRKDRGLPAGFNVWYGSVISVLASCYCVLSSEKPRDTPAPTRDCTVESGKAPVWQGAQVIKRDMTNDNSLRKLRAAMNGTDPDKADFHTPHHLQDRRLKPNFMLLMMVHHDFVSVFYCFYQWFTRPKRVAMLLCSIVTLMGAGATVFSTIMFKDDGTCGVRTTESECLGTATDNVNVGNIGSSCAWDEESRTCFLPEPKEDLETSLVVSTVSLLLSLPFKVFMIAIFAAFIARPTVPAYHAKTRDLESFATAVHTSSAVVNEREPKARYKQVPRVKEKVPESERSTTQVSLSDTKREFRFRQLGRPKPDDSGIPEDFQARLAEEVALMKATKGEEGVKEALLFERAEVDSLNRLERSVFQKSQIIKYEKEDDATPFSAWIKYLAWFFVVAYTVGVALYVCMFAVKAGRGTSIQWMISFWVAFIEDILVLIPLKLLFVYIFLPSLMRHRVRPDMFKRIPRYAPSVQIARRRPDLQVSALILQGRIPVGSELEKFAPVAYPNKRWFGCLTTLVFMTLALIMVLPDTLQAMVLDSLLVVFVGGVILAFSKLYYVSFWGLLAFIIAVAMAILIWWIHHHRRLKPEEEFRQSRQGKLGLDPVAVMTVNGIELPNQELASSNIGTAAGSLALARWVAAKKPDVMQPWGTLDTDSMQAVFQSTMASVRSEMANPQETNAESIASTSRLSGARFQWNNGPGRASMDSIAASQWAGVYISDSDTSAFGDRSLGIGDGTSPRVSWVPGGGNAPGSERSGLSVDTTYDSNVYPVTGDTNASFTFFNDRNTEPRRLNATYDSNVYPVTGDTNASFTFFKDRNTTPRRLRTSMVLSQEQEVQESIS